MREMSKEDIKTLVTSVLGDGMLDTIACESGFRQFDNDGRILRSKTDDVGITQINVDTWGLKAKELGLDIYTPLGNVQMAKHILNIQGKKAWVCYQLALKG